MSMLLSLSYLVRYLVRCLLILAGFALLTWGLLDWQAQRYALGGFWPFNGSGWHPLHLVILGLALIPAASLELLLLGQPAPADPAPPAPATSTDAAP